MKPFVQSRLDQAVTPITLVGGRPVRPREVVLDATATTEVRNQLRGMQAQPFDSDDSDDWRRAFAPPYVSIEEGLGNAQLELWTRVPEDAVDGLVADDNMPGIHYNTVYFASGVWDFHHGGGAEPPTRVLVEDRLPESAAEGHADLAILDTGLPANWQQHPARLRGVRGIDAVQSPYDLLDENKDAELDLQAAHGIFISGLVRQKEPNVGIEMYRVLSSTGEGDEATIIATLNHVRGSGVKVVSLSFGGFPVDDKEPLLAATIRALTSAGKLVVAAAGNAGQEPDLAKLTMFPASMAEVIAVGALGSTYGEKTVAPFSNAADVYYDGVDVLSTYVGWTGVHVPTANSWATWSGTSFATPVVAARLAADPDALTTVAQPEPGLPQKSVWPPEPATPIVASPVSLA
jgi:hypothetical protein